jgi:hypothetical protein
MSRSSAARGGAGLAIALMLNTLVAIAGVSTPTQDSDRTCLVCHDDAGLKSKAGKPLYVSATAFGASVHGRAGIGCVGCHTDLAGIDDFPHAADLRTVTCAGCHGSYALATAGGVHGTASPRLAGKPVACKDCHGTHEVFPSSDPRSSVHRANRPATCARCHLGAGGNFAKGRVHELAAGGPATPAGVVRILYKILIPVMAVIFLAYATIDLVRSRRAR